MSQSTYEAVTLRIVEALEKGVVPWRKPWQSGSAWPCNGYSGRMYSGINVFLLSCSPFRDHRWLTFSQARALGGYVRPEERNSLAVFWKRWEVPRERDSDAKSKRTIPILKHHPIFNIEQCEEVRVAPLEPVPPRNTDERIEAAQAMARAMPDGPEVDENCRDAWYRPKEDMVGMPPFESFESADAFYAILFHEIAHATGHEKRLNRAGVMGAIQFGSETYGHEELVAEMSSAFICAELGLDNSLLTNSAAYIQNWLTVLRANPKAVVIAAAQAQRAANLIKGVTPPLPAASS
ncbi:MAG: ArdC family protein [Fimbriimonadaceae bacterium]